MRRDIRLLYFILLTWLGMMSFVQARELHLVTAALPPIASTEKEPGYMELIAREAFGRIGIDVTISSLPGERALLNANAGIDDGDLLRIAGLEKNYPNLVRIPEKVMDFEFVAFTRDAKLKIKSIADLKQHTVAYITGWKYYEKNIRQAKNITRARDLSALFQLLQKRRAEVVLAEHWQGLWLARQEGIKVNHIHPPIKVADMYIYLHKKHAALVPKVAQAIMAMKLDGSFQRILAEKLHTLEDHQGLSSGNH